MPLQEAMLSQRAVRRVLPDPVDDEIVLRCIELALKAPTGSNGQNWEFVIVKDVDVKAALAARYQQAWKVYGAIGHRLNKGDESMIKVLRAVEWQVDHFEEIPVLVVACLQGLEGAAGADAADRRRLLLRLHLPQRAEPAPGRPGHGPRGVTDHPAPVEPTAARRALGLPISVQPACVVPLGWPRGRYGPTTRRPVGDVVHLDRFGNQPFKE